MSGRRADAPDDAATEDVADQPDDQPGDAAADLSPLESSATASRRRAAELIGDVLPDQTSEELDPGDWRDEVGGDRDDQLRADVPPHY